MTATKRRWFALASVMLGVTILIISANSRGWTSDFLLNLGSSVLLIVPVLWLTAMLERNIERSAEESRTATQMLASRVDETEKENRRSLEEIRASFQGLQAAREERSSELISNITQKPGYASISAALKHFMKVGTISNQGVRLRLGEPGLWCTVLQRGSRLDIDVERASGEQVCSVYWLSEIISPETVFDDIAARLEVVGSYVKDGLDPSAFFNNLERVLSVAQESRMWRGGNDPGPARQYFPPQWMLYDDGVATVRGQPYYFVPYSRTHEDNWRRQLGEKPWVDYSSFDEALTTAENLGWANPFTQA